MKNTMKILSLILISGFITIIKAESNDKFNVYIKEQKKVYIELREFGENYSVTIKNSIGSNIYEAKNLNIENLKFSVDLSEQKEGLYHLIAKNDFKMVTVPVIVKSGLVSLSEDQSKMTFFPRIVKDGNSVMVKLISNEKNDLQIDISNAKGESLYHTQIGGQTGLIGKRFKFWPGDYIVSFNSDDYHFQRELSIE